MLRRLEKRVLVDLPSKEAREAMFQQLLPPTVIRESNGLILFSDLDYQRLGQVRLDPSKAVLSDRLLVYRRLLRCRYSTCLQRSSDESVAKSIRYSRNSARR